jgi:hypothetical protein
MCGQCRQVTVEVGISMAHDVSRPGALWFASGSRNVACTVQHSSASGAHVKVPNASSIRHRFELDDGALRRLATVVWRMTNMLGVRFDEYFQGR